MSESAVENILSQVNSLSPGERDCLIRALTAEGSASPAERSSIYGKYAGKLTSVDEFLRRKHEENDLEDQSGSV
jgi:hypothetical protein